MAPGCTCENHHYLDSSLDPSRDRQNSRVAAPVNEDAVRPAALDWIRRRTLDGTRPITREELANDFVVGGVRFPLIDRGRGIRKPVGWRAALSITTAVPKSGVRQYEDDTGLDGLHRYKLRRDQRGRPENESLRAALRERTPIAWFVGLEPGLFNAVLPVYLIGEEFDKDQFILALTPEQLDVDVDSPMEAALRRYLLAETKRRLHQPLFASKVMLAYDVRCAVCALHHRELLDAAHIIEDSDPLGIPVVPNGLALCKMHHAAYDQNILGIRPDHVVEIHNRLLDEIDGPMLRHGLQQHHGRQLMNLPRRRADLPDPDRLLKRYKAFQAA
jgi:putative restriction endonuclease